MTTLGSVVPITVKTANLASIVNFPLSIIVRARSAFVTADNGILGCVIGGDKCGDCGTVDCDDVEGCGHW